MMLYIIVIYVVIYKYIYAVYIIPTYPNRKIHKNHWIPSPGDAWSPSSRKMTMASLEALKAWRWAPRLKLALVEVRKSCGFLSLKIKNWPLKLISYFSLRWFTICFFSHGAAPELVSMERLVLMKCWRRLYYSEVTKPSKDPFPLF